MIKIFLCFALILFNQICLASHSVKLDIYKCIFEYGGIKKIKIANEEIMVPQDNMPMPCSSTSNPDCMIYKNKIHKNGLLLDKKSSDFLNSCVTDVAKAYNKICLGKQCANKINCKILTQSITLSINKNINEDIKHHGRLAETEMIFKQIVEHDKDCIKKIEGLYNSNRLLFFKDSKCINHLSITQENYIQNLMNSDKYKWSSEFHKCISNIKYEN